MFHLAKQVCIDLGTANAKVLTRGEGVVLDEPTIVAVSESDHRVLAIGKQAKEMIGRTSGDVAVIRPMRHGVIADYAVTEALVRYFLQQALGRFIPLKPEVLVTVPTGSTQVERRAMLDAVMSAGARTAYLVDEPLAAIVGAGVSIAEASGNMILNIGAGSAECAVVSLGGVVSSSSVRVGGDAFDEAIQSFLRKKHGLHISSGTAEAVKKRVGSALKTEEKKTVVVRGRDVAEGLPKEVRVTSDDVAECLKEPLQHITAMVKKVLANVPPELASDLIDKGILLAGGGALLPNMDRYMTEAAGVPVVLCEEPTLCVITGMDKIFGHIEQYKKSLEYRK